MKIGKGVVCLFLLLIGAAVKADPNAILADAIKKRASINVDTPTEARLDLYSAIFKNLDQIIAEYPSSEQAIKLLSNQSIGDFDPQTLRAAYIKELTNYYDTVCEATPSYACLGFVSLSAGQRSCVSAQNASEINAAHRNLSNAAKIFLGQEESSYATLALSEYRGCLDRSKFKTTDYVKDLFASDLVELTLLSGKNNIATAIIENIKTPAFKVQGVLALSKAENKPFDDSFNQRLKKYIEEKVEDKNGNRQLAALDLLEDNFKRGQTKISYDDVRWGFRTGRDWGAYQKQCDPFFSADLLNKVFNLQKNIISLEPARREYNKGQVPPLMSQVSNQLKTVLNACLDRQSDTKEFALSALLHGQIILISQEGASEFREGVLEKNWTSSEQVEYSVNLLGKHKELFEAQLGLIKDAPGNKLVDFKEILSTEKANYPVFKQLVNYGNVCEASKLLFQKIKGKPEYNEAIAYMIDASNIDISKKHSCGDASLELLLK